jgi:bifunctional non-homologous end joining protein LigD
VERAGVDSSRGDHGGSPGLPPTVAPMLATPGTLPSGGGWAFEFKWDGIRAITRATPSGLRIVSRNDRDITAGYPDLAHLADLTGHRNVVLDGEIVALDTHGRPSFARLQQRMHVRDPAAALVAAVPVAYHVFDVLYLDGEPVLHLPYRERRDLLTGLGLDGEAVRVPPHFTDVDGENVLTAAQAYGFEGVMAKRLGSAYQPGRRSRDWIKVPLNRTQEVVVVGYKPGEGRRAGTVGSLLVAVSRPDGTLAYAGGVGTGFTQAMLADLSSRFAALTRPDPPLSDVPRPHARGARWLEPALVGEVAFRTWTPDGRLRHPSWRGLRPDKSPGEVQPAPAPRPAAERILGAMTTPDGRWRVEIVARGTSRWYRVSHADNVLDWLPLASVERILAEAGVDMRTLRETRPADAPAEPARAARAAAARRPG